MSATIVLMTTKFCKKCQTEKLIDAFSKDVQKRDGLASSCKECKREYHARWMLDNGTKVSAQRKVYYAENRETLLANQRERLDKNPEAKAKARAYTRRWRAENPERVREHRLKQYGITPEQHDAKFEEQGGVCAMCGKSGKLVTDHDHITGEFRSLLHGGCNTALGSLGDDFALIAHVREFFDRS